MPALARDLDALTTRRFDVLVVGGGIYGLAIAYDAAQRGLSVALVERDDFGSGNSFNHLRTIHGGLRYLQTLDIRRARESVGERRTMARIAPHAVRPMPFALPLYRSLTRGRLAMRAGLLLDRAIANGRNRGVGAAHRLPPGRVVSRDEAIVEFPGLRRQGLTGAAVWYDYVTTEADRLTFSFALAAANHGAILANYVEADSLVLDGNRVVGIRAHDHLPGADGRSLEIRAALVVVAAGSMTDRLVDAAAGTTTRPPLLMAMNLVTRREAGDTALGGKAPSGRNLFLVPWRGRALFGTWESATPSRPDATLAADDLAAFVGELNQAFPSLDLTMRDVSLVHRGIVPASANGHGGVKLEGHERVRELDGLLSVAGAKYTTARAVAERVTDRALQKLQKAPAPCRTASMPLPGGDVGDVALAIAAARREFDRELPTDTIPHLIAAYGTRYRDVLSLCERDSALRSRLSDESPVIGAELVWAARSEMALTLEDAVVRRTPLGAVGHPGREVVERAAALVARELNWDAARVQTEVDALDRFYAVRVP